jgi:hypothetical protein
VLVERELAEREEREGRDGHGRGQERERRAAEIERTAVRGPGHGGRRGHRAQARDGADEERQDQDHKRAPSTIAR